MQDRSPQPQHTRDGGTLYPQVISLKVATFETCRTLSCRGRYYSGAVHFDGSLSFAAGHDPDGRVNFGVDSAALADAQPAVSIAPEG